MPFKPLTPELSTHWAITAQFTFLDALMVDPALEFGQFAFHGGTSLHFSWRSPRRSEDLNFLTVLTRKDLVTTIERAHKKTEETFRSEDPLFAVGLLDKTRLDDRMIAYHLVVSHPSYLGKALIKVEFWRVTPGYLSGYPVEFRSPIPPGDIVSRISNPVPSAKLETAYCDKLTAFATRPYLKWRDIYDLWWIGTQTDAALDLATVSRQFLHNVQAYETIEQLLPAQALRQFLALHDPDDVAKKADPDLKRWLPEGVWARLHPQVTRDMVRYTWHALDRVANAIENRNSPGSLKRAPP